MIKYRFILSHLEEGTKVIDEPVNWNEASFKLDRQDSHEVIFSYSTNLGFYGSDGIYDGGRDFIQNIVGIYGIDTEITLQLYTSIGITENYEFQEEWVLNLEDYEYVDDEIQGTIIYAPMERKGIQAKFDSRYDNKIDLSTTENLNGGALLPYPERQITMHSRQITKGFEGRFEEDSIFYSGFIASTPETRLLTLTIGWPVVTDEINEFFSLGTGFLSEKQRADFLRAEEEGSFVIDINIDATLRVKRILGDFDIISWKWIFQKNDEPVTIISQRYDTNVSGYEESLAGTLNTTVDIKIGDRLYLYGDVEIRDVNGNIFGIYNFQPEIQFKAGSYITITGVTTIPDNVVNCRMIHDTFAKVCDAITGENNSFYSEFLGHTTETQRKYDQDGEFSFYVLTNGAQIRNLIDRSTSISFKELYDSLNAVTPIGLGVDTIDGKEVIRLEHITHFYTDESVINLHKVNNLKVSVAKDKYIKSIEIGYSKGLPEDVGGLNEPNYRREYSTALKVVGEKASFISNFIASGSLIEQQRRESADTKDARYDNDVFIISLNRSNLSLAEKDENYSLVENLENASSTYNLRISPAMNLLRQGLVINAGLIKKQGSKYRPQSNEGNFQMITTASHSDPGNYNQQPLGESDDIIWNYAALDEVKPLWQPFILEFEHPLSFEEFLLLKDFNGRRKAISLSLDDVTYTGWIISVEYQQQKDGANKAAFKLIQSNEVPVELIDQDIQLLLLAEGGALILNDEDKGIKLN